MDTPTLSNEFQKFLSEDWKSAQFRRKVVPGKAVFSLLAKFTQNQFKLSLTPSRVIEELEPAEIDAEVQAFI